MSFAVGSLVKAREREWVVLPESQESLLVLRPLGGSDEDVTGIYLPLETVKPAEFELPSPAHVGDARSGRLLRDAVRLGFRSSAGPFRSFARIRVEPRPYQLVPLLMALKLDPVRLLIADDVGIGKTIEAGLIARELLDRGEIERLAVLCPPHLAEQWQHELNDKFHIAAELVLPSTARRLERDCAVGQTLFELYPHVIVSLDYIKSDRRRNDFLRTCPELVIVDEAHTCAYGYERRGGRQQRHQLITGLAGQSERHLILVTATPHSGKKDAFRSLLGLLNPEFLNFPEDLGGKHNERNRRQLATYFVQRRRADIRHYLETDTPFPDRQDGEETYMLTPEYKRLFQRVLNYTRDTITEPGMEHFRQRVRWWSALALLRALASSPAAAAATLRIRAAAADADTPEDADEIGRRTVMDMLDDEAVEGIDVIPGSDPGEEDAEQRLHRRLLDMARAAEQLKGKQDPKLQTIIPILKHLLKDGFKPILFCRFIATAEYVAEELRNTLKKIEVTAVTGTLPPAEREERVLQLAQVKDRILVCTDCLSEGINLQEHFDAVVHYDLSWNPTRHEQREGRVDRYGQPSQNVRVLTYYGIDNQIDGIVLDVLIRKHRTIRKDLKISIPVPIDTEQVVEAIFEGLLLRGQKDFSEDQLWLFDDDVKSKQREFHTLWDSVADKEKRSQTLFAQHAISAHIEEVTRELKVVRQAIGSEVDVERFLCDAMRLHGATVQEQECKKSVFAAKPNVLHSSVVRFDLADAPTALKDALNQSDPFAARFTLPVREGELYLHRTHPIVEGLASYLMDSALDPKKESIARRCGVMRTTGVDRRTTLLLLRLRYHIIAKQQEKERPLLAEDCRLVAFAGSPQNAEWLDEVAIDRLLNAEPDANISHEKAQRALQKILEGFEHLQQRLNDITQQHGQALLDAHRRVRQVSKAKDISYRVEPQLPPDVLGIYVYLPG